METTNTIPAGFYFLGFILFILLVGWIKVRSMTPGEKYWGGDDIHDPDTVTDPKYSVLTSNIHNEEYYGSNHSSFDDH